MPYRLVLSEHVEEKTRDVGENVFFDDLSSDYKVYMLYYPGAMPNQDLEDKLKSFGTITGANLFINIGRLNDPNYEKIRNKFNIKKLPVIIVTAIDELASAPGNFSTAFVRIDSKNLLNSPDRLMECLQKLFNLFIGGEISEAISEFKKDKLNVLVSQLKNMLKHAIKEIWEFIDERDISVSWIEGKFELKRSG
jgi:hypothetical protein